MFNKAKNNPFRAQNSFNNKPHKDTEKKAAEWGKVKFNPVAKLAAQESATPWSQFKSEIIQKQKDDAWNSQSDATNPNVKEFHQKREENYRRNLIESKKNEPTKWEDFSEEPEAKVSSKKPKQKQKNQVPNGKFQKIKSNIDFTSVNKDNFDARQLTADQNNYLKKVITMNTLRSKRSFKQVVNSLKSDSVQKKKFKPRK